MSSQERLRPRLLAALVAAAALCSAIPALAAQVTDVRIGVHPKFTRIVFELDGRAGYRVEHGGSEAAPELTITIEAQSATRDLRANGDVRSVKVEAGTKARARIALRQPGLRVKEMILSDPPRIVLDVVKPETEVAAATAPAPKAPATKPAPAPKPAAEPKATKPEAKPTPEPTPMAETKPAPAPKPLPELKRAPAPKPAAEAKPAPAPAPAPKVAPEIPTPTPAPAIVPPPRPTPPNPDEVAKPAPPPASEPKPAPDSALAPTPAPAITPPAEPGPAPTPDSVAKLPPSPAPIEPTPPAASVPVHPAPEAHPVTPPPSTPAAEPSWADRVASHPLRFGLGAALALLLSVAAIVIVMRRRRALPNDLDVTAIAEEVEQTAETDSPGRIPSGGFAMGNDTATPVEPAFAGLFDEPASSSPPPVRAAPMVSEPAPAVSAAEDSLFDDAGDTAGEPDAREGDAPMNQEMDLPVDRRTSPTAARMGGSAASSSGPSPDVTRMFQELERRIATLEARLDESNEAREKLERQVAAQSEELRVQRAAIARTQRALRTMTRGDEDKATEPALRDGETQAKTRVTP
jgi:hypothetical protein